MTLFAARNVARGEILVAGKTKYRHRELLSFLRKIDRETPAGLDLHFILDNDSTPCHPKVKAGQARHPRFHFHLIPTYSSWLDQVERRFGIVTQPAFRRGSFRSVKQLVEKVDEFVVLDNEGKARPFVWPASANPILAKIKCLCERFFGIEQ